MSAIGEAMVLTWAHLLMFALIAPWLPMALLSLTWTRPVGIALAPWAALPALAATFLLPADTGLEVGWLLLGVLLGIDGIARVFLFFTALLWWLAGWFATIWLAKTPGQARFTGFYLASMAGNLGLILAQDLLSFYLFFALMSFASYGLVVHSGKPEARRAGRVYIVLMLAGEACLFTGVAQAALAVDSLALVALPEAALGGFGLGLFMIGFGIKLGVLGLHVWLPLAHPAAPLPASAVLSGTMIKAGLLGWLRVLPLGAAGFSDWGNLLVYLGLGAAFYGVLMGITQRHPKIVLAYSSISQMGLMTVLVGVALAAPDAVPMALLSILLFAMHHALAKGALFLGIGVIEASNSAFGRGLIGTGMVFAALALAGAPWTSGALAKIGLSEALSVASLYPPLGLVLGLSSTATTLLMVRFLYLLHNHRDNAHLGQTPALGLPWATLLLALATVPWRWPGMQALAALALTPEQIVSAAWPVVLGILLAGIGIYKIPPGDVLVPVVAAGRWLIGKVEQASGKAPLALRLEQKLRDWEVVGSLLVLLLLLLVIALW